MEFVAATDKADITKGMNEVSLSSSTLSSSTPESAVAPMPALKKDAVPVIDIQGLSDQALMQLLQEKERKKQLERYERRQAKGQDEDREHKFWNTQPVPGLKDTFEGEGGPMDLNTDTALVKQDPYNMPAGFEWCSLDVKDPVVIQEVYTLLSENYVEDDDCLFRFDYSIPFLQWALTPPGFLQEWHVGVRNSKTGGLMGCITAIPADIRIHSEQVNLYLYNAYDSTTLVLQLCCIFRVCMAGSLFNTPVPILRGFRLFESPLLSHMARMAHPTDLVLFYVGANGRDKFPLRSQEVEVSR